MRVVIEKPLSRRPVGEGGSAEEAWFEVVDENSGKQVGRLGVSSWGLCWRTPWLVGGRGLPWRTFSERMTNDDDDKIERLIEDCRLSRAFATAMVRAGGRCEYCGRDLLRDRFGYRVCTVDRLLPASKCSEEVAECEYNWVLCCTPCNSAKHDWFPGDGEYLSSSDHLRGHRPELILQARAHIYERFAIVQDPVWHRVVAVMESRDAE